VPSTLDSAPLAEARGQTRPGPPGGALERPSMCQYLEENPRRDLFPPGNLLGQLVRDEILSS
jgi:hypothetical protein